MQGEENDFCLTRFLSIKESDDSNLARCLKTEYTKHPFLYQLKIMENPAGLGSTKHSPTADKVI